MKAALVLAALFLVISSFTPIMASSPGDFRVSQPKLPGTVRQIPTLSTPEIFVTVTSPNPLVNVTLFFRGLPNPPYPSNFADLKFYNKTLMQPINSSGNDYTYRYLMPRFSNQTNVRGLAEAFDTKGNVAHSSDQPSSIYYVFDFPPYASLDFNLYALDVNPRYMNLTMLMIVDLYNTETYLPISISDIPNTVNIRTNNYSAECCWSALHTFAVNNYQGIAQLYPFDNYTYTLSLNLSPLSSPLNYSRVTINRAHNLTASVPSKNLIPFSARNLRQIADDSAWNITSSVTYVPANGPKVPPQLVLVVHLERQPEQTEYLILIPIVVLYAFLGSSILLAGKGDLVNRLFVYLSIFLFTYAFISSVKALTVVPFLLGFSMAERFALALVPCTGILAIASIIAWLPRAQKYRVLIDLIAIGLAAYALWRVVQFSLSEYLSSAQGFVLTQVTYDLFHLERGFGWIVILALSSGAILTTAYSIGKLVIWRHRLQTY